MVGEPSGLLRRSKLCGGRTPGVLRYCDGAEWPLVLSEVRKSRTICSCAVRAVSLAGWCPQANGQPRLGPCGLCAVHPGGALRERDHDGTHHTAADTTGTVQQNMLHLSGNGKRFPIDGGRLHAVQQVRLQAAVPRDVRPAAGTTLRRSWQLLGQRQVLRLLPAPL